MKYSGIWASLSLFLVLEGSAQALDRKELQAPLREKLEALRQDFLDKGDTLCALQTNQILGQWLEAKSRLWVLQSHLATGLFKEEAQGFYMSLSGAQGMIQENLKKDMQEALSSMEEKYPALVKMRKQQSTQAAVSSMQSVINIYYSDNEGRWPETLDVLVGKYLKEIPLEAITGTREVHSAFNGKGGWVYEKGAHTVSINLPEYKGLRF